jgi:hypothetical protein
MYSIDNLSKEDAIAMLKKIKEHLSKVESIGYSVSYTKADVSIAKAKALLGDEVEAKIVKWIDDGMKWDD